MSAEPPSSNAAPQPAVPRVVHLTATQDHTFAIWSTGKVTVWGSNQSRVLALDAKVTETHEPTAVTELEGVRAIATSRTHSCSLDQHGTVRCWGRNYARCVARDSLDAVLGPTIVEHLPPAKQVAVDYGASFALLADGKVEAWGANTLQGMGVDTGANAVVRDPVVIPGLEPFEQIAIGRGNCGRHGGGAVTCWGFMVGVACDYPNEQLCVLDKPVVVPALMDVALIVGGDHFCAVARSGGVHCWGEGDQGQLGDGRFGHGYRQPRPQQVKGVSDAVSVTIGNSHTCAIRRGGGVLCWGDNSSGQLGTGDKVTRHAEPTDVPGLSDVVDLAAGRTHTCALRRDGAVLCWGTNTRGQLGFGKVGGSALTPTPVTLGPSP